MGKFDTVAAAEAAGYEFLLKEDEYRFVIEKNGATVGFAHFSGRADGSIDFDSTVVDPSERGTGLAGVLVRHALGHDLFKDAKVRASCWYVEAIILKNPEYLAPGAKFIG